MRMFLVGMCDIFLILYLTTLGQVDERAMSPLTVSDYERLKSELEEKKKALDVLNNQYALLTTERGSAETEKKRLENQIDTLKKLHASQSGTDRLKSKELEKELIALKKKAFEEKKSEQKKHEALQKKLRELEKAEKERASLKNKLTSLLKEKESLKKVADKERALKEKAEKEAEKRAAEAKAALAEVSQARTAEKEARKKASEATGVALSNRVNAYLASQDARRAEKTVEVVRREAQKTQKVLQSITQESEDAIERKIKPDSLRLLWELRKENVLIGSSSYKRTLRVIPVQDQGKTLVILPLEQLEIDYSESTGRYKRMNASISGVKVKQVLVSPDGKLAAFVVPDTIASKPRSLLPSKQATGVMPTLIALRNLSQLPFADRIRDVAEDFYVFNRDRLERDGINFVYRAKGVRGTGDYAGRILPGDTIVDLEGNVLGIAYAINKVRAVERTSFWKPVSLVQDSASVMRELKRNVGK